MASQQQATDTGLEKNGKELVTEDTTTEETKLSHKEVDEIIAASKNPIFHIKISGSNTSESMTSDNMTSDSSVPPPRVFTKGRDRHVYIDTSSLQLLYEPTFTSDNNLSLKIKVESKKDDKDTSPSYTISNAVISNTFLGFTQGDSSPYRLEFKQGSIQTFKLEEKDKMFAICASHKSTPIYLSMTEVPVYDKEGKTVGEIKAIIGKDDLKKDPKETKDKYIFYFVRRKTI